MMDITWREMFLNLRELTVRWGKERNEARWWARRMYRRSLNIAEMMTYALRHESRMVAEYKAKCDELASRVRELEKYIQIFIVEECAEGEQHCTCVPALRERVRELEAELAHVSPTESLIEQHSRETIEELRQKITEFYGEGLA